jgi:tellurite resistance protein TehA-like permease
MNVPPGSGAVVMGTGIVSVAIGLEGEERLSRIVFWIALITWLGLAVVLGVRLLRNRPAVLAEARSPAGLTAVAATSVLGTRMVMLGDRAAATVMLGLAVVIWLSLTAVIWRYGHLPTRGSVFMLTVAVQSLAVLAALLAEPGGAMWLVDAALVSCALGLVGYPVALARFDLREVVDGLGDQWVAGGALAISTLAISETSLAASRLGVLGHDALAALHAVAVVVWAVSVVWLVVLTASEVAAPRLRYDVRRWSTVFPVGMYAVCSAQLGRIAGIGALRDVGRVWSWVSLAVWLLVASAAMRAAPRVVSELTRKGVVRTTGRGQHQRRGVDAQHCDTVLNPDPKERQA